MYSASIMCWASSLLLRFLKAGGGKKEANPQFKCDGKDTMEHKGAPLCPLEMLPSTPGRGW